MPHKHTRRAKDESDFNLPPSQIARSLPTTINSKKVAEKKTDNVETKGPQKRKRGKGNADDAPRAFKRLMAFASGKPQRDGLDNGDAPEKGKGKGKGKGKEKTKSKATPDSDPADTTAPEPPTPAQELKLRPGERLSEFNQRVDAALPISGLVNKTVRNGKDPLGIKVRRTKKERKMHNMYAEWREIDRKVQERREEERELAEEREMDNEAAGVSWKLEMMEGGQEKKKGKKGKRGRYIGEEGGPERDPWAEIKKKRGEAKVGIHDVAQAPPELKLPRKNLLVRGAAVAVEDIPKAAGSLRQREELQGIRDEVVASYRKMMSERRPAVGT
ncbi:hypothetical protein C8A05DRAFT_35171 [Staphylotrichum tortipilum]|uniref:Urease accessory protein UreD n=1 Tax=Staphylotrichum tortipilum TaxID=2831512 RepID=A0AAN6MJ61_9PEZI|nr:hypothetical protein C8A05DRAFT_35171 [Staphylotrichum longicolle]